MKKLVVVVVYLMALAAYAIPPDATNIATGLVQEWYIAEAPPCYTSAPNHSVSIEGGGEITRPVLTVSIVTNVTVADNSSGCACFGQPHFTYGDSLAHFENCKPYRAATEKTETTEVIKNETLRFDWDGEECVIERKKVLSRKVRRWVRKDDWVEVEE